MKPILIVPWRNGFGDLALDFHPEVIGEHEIPPTESAALGQREGGRQYRYRWMHQQAVDAVLRRRELRVVEVIGVHRDPVDQRRQLGRAGAPCADHRRHAARAGKSVEVAGANDGTVCPGARQRQAEAVQNGLLAQLDHLLGDILVTRIDHKVSDIGGEPRHVGESATRRCGRRLCLV
jgi:hypothetical protein